VRRVALPPHVVEFSADDDLAAPALAALYPAAPESAAPPTFRYRLERGRDGDWTARAHRQPPFGPAALGDAWAFLEWRAIEDVLHEPGPDAVYVHAAGVRIGGRLVLLVGGPGSGKSTLTALLLRRGHPILGDDVLRFDAREGCFGAVPRSIKLDPLTLRELGLGGMADRGPEGGTFLAAGAAYTSPAVFLAGWEAGRGPAWGVVLLGGPPHTGPALLARRGEGGAAVRLLQGVLGNPRAGAASGPGRADARLRLLESLEGARAWEAGGADPARLADLIVEAVRT